MKKLLFVCSLLKIFLYSFFFQMVGGYQFPGWNNYGPTPYLPSVNTPPKPEPLGQVTDFIQNEECFKVINFFL